MFLFGVWSMFYYALLGVLFSFAIITMIERERKRESWLIKGKCLLAVFCLSVRCVSSLRCHCLAGSV